jgi:hypothetical protein
MSRILKATPDAQAGVSIGREAVRVAGSRESFFYADRSGCYITGKISLVTNPEDIRIGTLWTLPRGYLGQLPSTTATPQPMYVINPPITGFADIAAEVARLLSELV